MGSVKNLILKKKASTTKCGLGIFEFTDDFSVFDYGKMPDTIPGKGESLCRMSAYNFEQLKKRGIKGHYLGMPRPNQMKVKLVRVLFPQKGELKKGMKNYLVPLEVIFRNSLPTGSSVFKRIEKGELNLADFGLKAVPKPGQKLEKPILDVSTKLENTDRYLSWTEAFEMSCLPQKQFEQLKKQTLQINDFITKRAEKLGLEHADGKVEWALDDKGKLMLVDVCGTLDENRMLFNGLHVSKEVMRQYYKTTPWYAELERAKAAGAVKGTYPKAPNAPRELIQIVSNMYKSVCEAWIGKKVWKAPTIEQTVEASKAFLEKTSIKSMLNS